MDVFSPWTEPCLNCGWEVCKAVLDGRQYHLRHAAEVSFGGVCDGFNVLGLP